MSISKIITTIGKAVGTQAKVTLGKKQVLEMVQSQNPKIADELSQALSKMKDPKFDIAYKASERGYTVGAVSIRDDKTVVGNGALSVTGLGTENAVLKARVNIGKNGEIFSYSGHNSYAETIRLEEMDYLASVRQGVAEIHQTVGKAGAGHVRLDIPKAAEAIGKKEEGAVLLKRVNEKINKIWGKARDLLAGKEPEFMVTKVDAESDKFVKVGKTKFNRKELKFTSGLTPSKMNFEKITKDDILTAMKKASNSECYKDAANLKKLSEIADKNLKDALRYIEKNPELKNWFKK